LQIRQLCFETCIKYLGQERTDVLSRSPRFKRLMLEFVFYLILCCHLKWTTQLDTFETFMNPVYLVYLEDEDYRELERVSDIASLIKLLSVSFEIKSLTH
jgi:hypothetical protein